MRLWKVLVLLNLALGVGIGLGYLRWAREVRSLQDEIDRLGLGPSSDLRVPVTGRNGSGPERLGRVPSRGRCAASCARSSPSSGRCS